MLYEGPKASNATALLRAIEAGDEQGVTATLTIDEVVWIASREASRADAIEQGRRLLSLPHVTVVDVTATDALEMLDVLDRNDHLRPRDAFHVAAMDAADVDAFVTDDGDFDAIDEVTRIGLETPIVEP